ncbi:MAG: hypothetical protein VKI81_11610, partial [Synechococcaceae cyanobacterium]|nr:hypothetical protein [Synechococcaceae cyanobacterium]
MWRLGIAVALAAPLFLAVRDAAGATREEAIAGLKARLPLTLKLEIIPEASLILSAGEGDLGLTVAEDPAAGGVVPKGAIELLPDYPDLFEVSVSGTTEMTPYV